MAEHAELERKAAQSSTGHSSRECHTGWASKGRLQLEGLLHLDGVPQLEGLLHEILAR